MSRVLIFAMLLGLVTMPAHAAKPDHAKNKKLPPGLQKKIDRGGALPPGWEKKLNKGSVLEKQVYEHSRPVDDRVRVKLPVGPSGTIDIQVEGKIVRIYKATRIIQEVFNSY